MKTAHMALAVFFAVSIAQADKLAHFKCRTTQDLDVGPVSIHFSVKLKSSGEFQFIDPNSEHIYHVTPKESQMSELDDNGAIHQDKPDQVEFFGDGDGFVFVYLNLFKNSGYRAGYARIDDHTGGNDHHYSPVACDVTYEDL